MDLVAASLRYWKTMLILYGCGSLTIYTLQMLLDTDSTGFSLIKHKLVEYGYVVVEGDKLKLTDKGVKAVESLLKTLQLCQKDNSI